MIILFFLNLILVFLGLILIFLVCQPLPSRFGSVFRWGCHIRSTPTQYHFILVMFGRIRNGRRYGDIARYL